MRTEATKPARALAQARRPNSYSMASLAFTLLALASIPIWLRPAPIVLAPLALILAVVAKIRRERWEGDEPSVKPQVSRG